MTHETQKTQRPNEVRIDPKKLAELADGSADELRHPDFAAMDQLDSLPSSDELRRSSGVTDNVLSSIGDAPSRRKEVVGSEGLDNKQNFDIANQPEAIDSDPTPNGIDRKKIAAEPTTFLGRLAVGLMNGGSLAGLMNGGSLAGTRAHGETVVDAEKRKARQDLIDRKNAVINRLNPSADPVVNGIADRTKVQKDLDKLFKK